MTTKFTYKMRSGGKWDVGSGTRPTQTNKKIKKYSELWIRIHWNQIRIQHFKWIRILIQIQLDPGFWWPKTEEKKYIFDQKLQFTSVQAIGEAFSPQKRTSSSSKNKNLLPFFYVCGSFFCPPGPGSWSRIRIRIRIQGPHWIRIQVHSTGRNKLRPSS